jgi:tripartite-type tricarboxylate transporter receptor subunit TctC
MTQWYGMLAPAKQPQADIDKLAAECARAMRAPDTIEHFRKDAAQPVGGTPAQFAQFIQAEQKRWKIVVDRAHIRPE